MEIDASPGFDKRFSVFRPFLFGVRFCSNGRLPLVGKAFALFAAEMRNHDVEARGFRKI
jgi:hypothetical protein